MPDFEDLLPTDPLPVDPPVTPTQIETISTQQVYSNHWMSVRESKILRVARDGSSTPGIYAVVDKPHSAVVVAWNGTHIRLVGQKRYPLDAWSWELPQGALHDGKPHSPEQIARTELLEETGISAGELKVLAQLAFAPGMTSQRYTAFLATDLSYGEPQPELEEQGLIVQKDVTPTEFWQMVGEGIVDATTIAVWSLAERDLGLKRLLS